MVDVWHSIPVREPPSTACRSVIANGRCAGKRNETFIVFGGLHVGGGVRHRTEASCYAKEAASIVRVTQVGVTVVEVPQTAPLAPYRSHLRSSSTTQSAIVRVDTDAGITGWGEHNINFLPDISARRMEQEARAWLIGCDPQNIAAFHQHCPLETRLKSGIELALWDICGKAAGLPVAVLLGGIVRERVEVAACMGIQSYERAKEMAAWYVEQGFGTLKTKAGADMQEDLEMVRGVRDAVGDKLKLRIDPNRAYSPQQALELARRLEPYDLEYLEQPIAAEPLTDARVAAAADARADCAERERDGSGERAGDSCARTRRRSFCPIRTLRAAFCRA